MTDMQTIRQTLATKLKGSVDVGDFTTAGALLEAMRAMKTLNGTAAKPKSRLVRKAKAAGRRGRPAVPADVVAKMKQLKAKGLPASKIAAQVGLSHFTVYKYTKG